MVPEVELLQEQSELLHRLSRSPRLRFSVAAHASDRMTMRGIVTEDIRAVLQNGTVISIDEIDDRPRWIVEGKTLDGDTIRVVVIPYETEESVRIVTAYYADTLGELTSEPSASLIAKRVSNWVDRIEALYTAIDGWLPDGWTIVRRDSVVMHEELMRKLDIPPRQLPTLIMHKQDGTGAQLQPRGLWIVGTNGRLDLLTGHNQFMIIDQAATFSEPNWKIARLDKRNQFDALTRETFAAALLDA
jgi:uncharacterized DUF497 family protein